MIAQIYNLNNVIYKTKMIFSLDFFKNISYPKLKILVY